jgi:hypothetical protein|tara:strand:+ start:520 stop:1023 length:504 start_codon:yes stop_codon:yes gene_type:complete
MAVIYSYPIKNTPTGGDTMIISDMADSKRTKQVLLTDLKTLINTTYTLTASNDNAAGTAGAADINLNDSDGSVDSVKIRGKGAHIIVNSTVSGVIDIEALTQGRHEAYSFNTEVQNPVEISHTLGGYPSVTTVDSANTVVTGTVTYLSTADIQIQFTADFAGIAYLN